MVELIVENESLDLFPNEVISLTLAVNDMASIESLEKVTTPISLLFLVQLKIIQY